MGNPYDEPRYITCANCGARIRNDPDYYVSCSNCGEVYCLNCADDFIDGYCDECYEPEEEADE